MKPQLTIGRRLFASHLLAILLVSGCMGSYFYSQARQSLYSSLQQRLLSSATLMGATLDAEALDEIRTADDVGKPAYQDALARLRALRRSSPDFSFVYIMRRVGDRVEFVVDSDESDKAALPGRVYPGRVPALLRSFRLPSVDEAIVSDEWGGYLSGYAPLRNGKGEYLVGVDIRADHVYEKFDALRAAGLFSLVASLFLALLFSAAGERHFLRYIDLFVQRCRMLAADSVDAAPVFRTGSELDRIAQALDEAAERLAHARADRDRAEEALRSLNAELEAKVAERTTELRQRNEELSLAVSNVRSLSGLLPICASCKKIRDDRGYWRQVEEYVASHSEAQFTHGMCPQCLQQFTEDLDAEAGQPPPP